MVGSGAVTAAAPRERTGAAGPSHAARRAGRSAQARCAAVVLAALVGACSSGGGDDPGGSTTTTVRRTTAVDAPLAVGQCGDVERIVVGGALDPAGISTVDCAQPHDVEVAAVFDFPAGAAIDFPGAAAVDGYALEQCVARFEDYVGTAYESSSLDVAFAAPDEDGWSDGDRRIACVLYHVDFQDLTGSVAATAR